MLINIFKNNEDPPCAKENMTLAPRFCRTFGIIIPGSGHTAKFFSTFDFPFWFSSTIPCLLEVWYNSSSSKKCNYLHARIYIYKVEQNTWYHFLINSTTHSFELFYKLKCYCRAWRACNPSILSVHVLMQFLLKLMAKSKKQLNQSAG